MQKNQARRRSTIIGRVTDKAAGRVILNTGFGGTRIVDVLVGEQLPRTC
jgi:hydrogenase expression/formation protein HypE